MMLKGSWPLALLLLASGPAAAMGQRSFVALPVDTGGTVMRMQLQFDPQQDTGTLVTSLVHGLTARQALLVGLPYRVEQGGADDFADVSLLYRPTLVQQDDAGATFRLALLGGVLLPNDAESDEAFQGGFVTTWFRGRHELHFDTLYQAGLGVRRDSGRYDISWQYRLSPAIYPEWNFENEWRSVLELGGRWLQGMQVDHQVTAGLQWVQPRYVLEGGIVESLTRSMEANLLLSVRVHF